MGIVSITTDVACQNGDNPRRVKVITTDNLSTVTTAGYLTNAALQGYTILPTDVIDMIYSYSAVTNTGTYEVFTPSISNGVVTLVIWANAGDVLLPVVSGDVAIFNGTTGQIKDSSVAFSNATDTVAPLFHGTATVGDFVTVNNANKTIQDSGAAPSAASQAFVVMSPGSLTSGHLAKFSDVNGTLADQGFQIKSVAQAAVAGGAAAQTVTDSFCTSASMVVCTWNDTTNAVSIQKAVAGNGSFVVTSSGDPGASHLNYIITKV